MKIILYILLFECLAFSSKCQSADSIQFGSDSSYTVFIGTVDKIELVQVKGSRYRISFEVDSIIKYTSNKFRNPPFNKSMKKAVIYSGISFKDPDGFDCERYGIDYAKGEKYIVCIDMYAHDLNISTSCGCTKRIK